MLQIERIMKYMIFVRRFNCSIYFEINEKQSNSYAHEI